MTDSVDAEVERALSRVLDPCSVASRTPLSLIEMGLAKGWQLSDDGELAVQICVTTQACTMVGHLISGIEQAAAAVPGVRTVRVEVLDGVMWDPGQMSAAGQAKLAESRRRSIETTGVRPRQWKLDAR